MADKDRPLVLRRRKDGTYSLSGPPGQEPVWPPRHEFSHRWLMEAQADGFAVLGRDPAHGRTVTLTATNGRAVYRLTGDPSTGVWGVLVESTVEG